MTKEIIIIALVIVIIYLYYQRKQYSNFLTKTTAEVKGFNQTSQNILTFLQTNLNSNSLEELKTKLGEKTLNELLEENEDYETEVDTLTRSKESLEQDLLAQSNAFQNRLREKDREVKKLKKDLTNLEKEQAELKKQLKKMPGEFPEDKTELEKTHQEQLRKINCLFDEKAQDYSATDFNRLYSLLENIAEEQKKKKKQ